MGERVNGQVACCYERGNEPSGSTNCGDCLGALRNRQFIQGELLHGVGYMLLP
jgi:hypothetical protein